MQTACKLQTRAAARPPHNAELATVLLFARLECTASRVRSAWSAFLLSRLRRAYGIRSVSANVVRQCGTWPKMPPPFFGGGWGNRGQRWLRRS